MPRFHLPGEAQIGLVILLIVVVIIIVFVVIIALGQNHVENVFPASVFQMDGF